MARTTGRRMSRRKMLAVLSSGAVAAAATPSPALGLPCDDAASVGRFRVATSSLRSAQPIGDLLVVEACCEESRNLVRASFNGPKLGAKGKTHLAPVNAAMEDASIALEEYCFMVWGVKEAHRVEMQQTINDKLKSWGVIPYKPAK